MNFDFWEQIDGTTLQESTSSATRWMKEKSALAKSPQEENHSIQDYLQIWSFQKFLKQTETTQTRKRTQFNPIKRGEIEFK